ncbi:MAG TPA: hypothetical protein ENG78_04880 [Acidiferrobacteraceae bacterium]|nr:hypothetical protein [Acidiferrobacteraceae bacterium]HEX20135.1 hypothetical protein [Acidiferrobacteraceae bacterium]
MREEEALIVVGLFFLFIILVWYVVNVFYLLALSKALKRVDASRRGMSPGMVWLNLIPLFNLGWHIYTVVQRWRRNLMSDRSAMKASPVMLSAWWHRS